MDFFDYETDFEIEEFLERSKEQEQKRLEEEVERIEEQLEERDRLHYELLDELESKLDWYLDELRILYKQRRGKTGRRDEIKTRIREFYSEIQGEKRSHWRDRQELEQERRELLSEMSELDDTGEIFDLL